MNDQIKRVLIKGKGCLVLALALMVPGISFAEIVPAARRIAWQGNVGVPGGIPNVTTVYTTFTTAPTESDLQTALDSCPSNQVVQLGAWTATYSANLQLAKNGAVLRGSTNAQGKPTTVIVFSGGNFALRAPGFSETAMNNDVNLASDGNKGDTTLTLASVPSWVTVGELYIIDELDDPLLVSGVGEQGGQTYREIVGNGARGKAQTVKVLSKNSTTVTLDQPLNENYRVSQAAQLAQYPNASGGSLKRAGVENIRFEYAYASSGKEAINFYGCDSCWLKNIEGYNCPGTYHVWVIFNYRCEIRHSYFSYSHYYGAGQGYGIALYHYTTASLFEDNIVEHTHCGVTVNYGSSGNVFGYNYFPGGVSDARQEPSISAHGVSTWDCLFEGNFCHNKLLWDFTHGSAGVHHTAFRNRIEGLSATGNDQVPVSIERYSRENSIVGNVLGVAGVHGTYAWVAPAACNGSSAIYRLGYFININCDAGTYDDPATLRTIIHGNYDVVTKVNGGIVWDPTISDHTLPSSLYLSSKPAWFGDRPWPPYDPGSPSTAVSTNIPAAYRYVFGFDPPTGPVNQLPIAKAAASPLSGNAPLLVAFSSSGSSDPEGAALTYSWDFGDTSAPSTLANPSHTYQADGTYIARLTVSDGTNVVSSGNLVIGVGNQPPIAVARADRTSGFAPLTVAFSSSGSSDPEGATLSYNWVFGDGTSSSAANPTHTYQAQGNYVAQLVVSDGVKTNAASAITIRVTDPLSSLVAAYGFEEGTGTSVVDASGNGNNGTITGGGTWATGRFGNALRFNGIDCLVTVNDSSSLDLTNGLTLEAWVNPTTIASSWRDVIYKATDTYFLMGFTPQGPPDMGGLFASGNVFGASVLPTNTWTHIAGTYDGTTMHFYVNGVEVSTRPQTGPVLTSNGPLTIGGDNIVHGAGPQFWSGLIDEVRIYSRALSASEIQTDMQNPVNASVRPPPPSGLRVVGP